MVLTKCLLRMLPAAGHAPGQSSSPASLIFSQFQPNSPVVAEQQHLPHFNPPLTASGTNKTESSHVLSSSHQLSFLPCLQQRSTDAHTADGSSDVPESRLSAWEGNGLRAEGVLSYCLLALWHSRVCVLKGAGSGGDVLWFTASRGTAIGTRCTALGIGFPFLMQDSCPGCLSFRSWDAGAGAVLPEHPRRGSGSCCALPGKPEFTCSIHHGYS